MLAFKEAYDVLSAAPSPPPLTAVTHQPSFRDAVTQIERRFARDVSKWRGEILATREAVRISLEQLLELSDDPRGALGQLQDLINFSEEMLVAREEAYQTIKSKMAVEADLLATVSRDDAKFFRKSVRRYLDLVEGEYEDRLAFFNFLKRLHADHDPDARGGPTFENAEDLIAHLRS